AGRVDHVLLAVHQVDPAVPVAEGDVAGVEETVGDLRRRRLRVLPVAGRDLRAARPDLPVLAVRQVVPGLVDDPQLRVVHGTTHGQRAGLRVDRSALAHRPGGHRRG